MQGQSTESGSASPRPLELTPLTGVRFFAVFHIFLYHLWSSRYEADLAKGPFKDMYGALDALPPWLNNLLAHGYLSTSFFFLLSGFILAYLYWAPNGGLSTSTRKFWWSRFTRLYPIHIIVLVPTLLPQVMRYFFDPGAPPLATTVASAVTTATLMQAWFPPLVPIISWPTWALSALVFLYLVMPWLMHTLARLTRAQMLALLIVMPVISLIPTLVFLQFFPDGAVGRQNWQIFLGSTPLFWVPHFAAGMLLSRLCGISRFDQAWRAKPARWLALGDLALLGVIAVCVMEPHSEPWKFVLRHGLMMPLYLLVIHDMALGRGIFARLFSLPGMSFLGQTAFSIFIWQNFLMMVTFIVVYASPGAVDAAIWIAIGGVLVVSVLSTYLIEKPLAAKLRRRFNPPQPAPALPATAPP